MNQAIYEKLKLVAKEGQTITYSEIAPLINLDMSRQNDRNEIGWILGEISEYEHGKIRPMLSAIVVRKERRYPGPGFFRLAQELGVYDGSDDLTFFVEELRRVHEYWGSQSVDK